MREAPTTEEIRRLAVKHIALYVARAKQAQSGAKHINVLETARYLGVWKNIMSKDCRWEQLSKPEQGEILEALEAGE